MRVFRILRAAMLGGMLGVVAVSSAAAQRMTVSAGSVMLAAADTVAYDSGVSASGTFTVAFPQGGGGPCNHNPGCTLRVSRTATSSAPGVEVQISIVGTPVESSGAQCTGQITGWMPVTASPMSLVITGNLNGNRNCLTTVAVRVTGLSYGVHQFPDTYFRDILFSFSRN